MSKSKPPRSYQELEHYLPYLVNRLANLGQAAQNRMLQANDINLVSLRTLSILEIEDGLTINEIAERTFSEQSSTSRAIEAMVSQDLVERRTPDHDQRRREVRLTPRGRAQLHDSWPSMEKYFEKVSAGTTPEDRETCRAVLVQMLENLARFDH